MLATLTRKFGKFAFAMKRKLIMAKLGTFALDLVPLWESNQDGSSIESEGRVEVAEIEITLPLWVA